MAFICFSRSLPSYAEAFLVDDEQAEILECDVFGEDAVRADDDADLAVLELVDDLFVSSAEASKQPDRGNERRSVEGRFDSALIGQKLSARAWPPVSTTTASTPPYTSPCLFHSRHRRTADVHCARLHVVHLFVDRHGLIFGAHRIRTLPRTQPLRRVLAEGVALHYLSPRGVEFTACPPYRVHAGLLTEALRAHAVPLSLSSLAGGRRFE